MLNIFGKIKTFKVASCVFLTPATKNPLEKKEKKKTVIRGNKDRPPRKGSLQKGISTGVENSLTNNGGKAVDCWSEEALGKDIR